MDPLPFSKLKKIFVVSFAVFAVSMCYAKTEIIDLKEPGEVKLRSGNVVTFEKLCIDGFVYLYFKQLSNGNDGLTQSFIDDFRGLKVPQRCAMIEER